MATIFDIEHSFIQQLSSSDAENLIARLCRAELRSQNISEVYVTWSGEHIATDGGVDIRLANSESIFKKGFIKAENTIFQVKAENYSLAKIYEEMEPKGKIRDVIADLKAVSGAYIIVSTKDYITDKPLQKRIETMRECLKKHNLEKFVLADFYDSRRIADWVENHPSITAWLRDKVGKPLKAWKPYGAWAYREEDSASEYFIDDKARVFTPHSNSDCVDISQAIAQLRSELKQPVSIRLVGLSGVGKTRLVQALFDPKVYYEFVCPPAENAIYTDLANDPNPTPQDMLESLQAQNADSIVIVDNCGSETHASLTNIIVRKANRLRLITIEYDIRDDLPESTSCYRLESASPEVIKKLLRKRYELLSSTDLERIVEFSDGNARVALAVADTAERGGELAQLRDAALFTRLFHQKYQENDELLRCAQAASLLYSFDGENLAADGELALLASLAEVSIRTFSRYLVELKRRGLVQQRGQWRALLPHAIANNLAKQMLESLSSDLFSNNLIDGASERVARSFTRRLSFLHDSIQAQTIAAGLLAPNGKFSNLWALNDFERQMFINVAPVNPSKALALIKEAAQHEHFVSLDNLHRSTYISLVRQIAYEPKCFEAAVFVLKGFALVEVANNYNNPARNALSSLFTCYRSGTQAKPELRCQVARQFLLSTNEKERELGVNLVREGLRTANFQLSYNADFGVRRRNDGWRPLTKADITRWYSSWINLIASIANEEHLQRSFKTILADALPKLWGKFEVDKELTKLAQQWRDGGGWPEGWAAIKKLLSDPSIKNTPQSLQYLKQLEALITPSNLIDEIYSAVFVHTTTAVYSLGLASEEVKNLLLWPPGSELHEKLIAATEALGAKAAAHPTILGQLIPDFCSVGRSKAELGCFGKGVGIHCHDMPDLLDLVRNYIKNFAPHKVDLLWVRGLLAGWKEQAPADLEKFLDSASVDSVWLNYFGDLQTPLLDGGSFDRLIRAIEAGCPVEQFDYLRSRHLTETLSVSQIMEVNHKLASRSVAGTQVAILILYQVIIGVERQSENYKNELSSALWLFLNEFVWKADELFLRNDHYFEAVLDFALQTSHDKTKNSENLNVILAAVKETPYITDLQKTAIRRFFKYFPELALNTVCDLNTQQAIIRTGQLVANPLSEDMESALTHVPKDILLRWCSAEPQVRYPFAAENCKLFEDDATANLLLSDMALSILKSAPDKKSILNIFAERFEPFSDRNSRSLELRLCLFDQLRISQDLELNILIDKCQSDFKKLIQNEKTKEKEEMQRKNTSFE